MYCTSDYKTYVLFFEVNGVWNIGFVDVSYISNSSVKSYVPRRNIVAISAKVSEDVKMAKSILNRPTKKVSAKKSVKNVK